MSFKVICIDILDHHPELPGDCWQPGDPEVCEICEVVGHFKEKGVLFYQFAGYGTEGYDSFNFSPISGISQEEIEEENQQQEIDHLDRVWEGIVKEMDKMENA